VSAKGDRGQVCVSNEGASWLDLPTLGLSSENIWAREIFDGKHFPLRMVSYDRAGTEESRLEVTKFERKPVLHSTFAVPGGYRTVDFGQMIAGMQGLLSGVMGGAHGATASPSGLALPPGMAMPSGLALPNGMKLPKEAAEALKKLQEQAKAAAAAAAGPKP